MARIVMQDFFSVNRKHKQSRHFRKIRPGWMAGEWSMTAAHVVTTGAAEPDGCRS
jgi:hypothetical protein